MVLGKPVVTTSLGAEGINVKHNENILIANTSDGFIREINRLLDDPEMYLKIQKNCKEFVCNDFNNEKICLALLNFYKDQLVKITV